jgi:hypothetical protein
VAKTSQRYTPAVRLDRALIADIGVALRSPPILAFLALEAVAGVTFVWRRGGDTVSTVVLVWMGMLALAFFAWWAGRHRLAHPEPDPVPAAGARAAFATIGVAGMVVWGFGISVAAGAVLFACGLGGWLWAAWRTAGFSGLVGRLTRDVRPFIPLLLLIGVPRLIIGGPAFVLAAAVALPSGIGQQLLYLIGLFAPLEALRGRAPMAAVIAALLFGVVHVPLLLDANHGDLLAAMANAVLFQASVGLIAVLAYTRHRAAVPIGVAHAMAIA